MCAAAPGAANIGTGRPWVGLAGHVGQIRHRRIVFAIEGNSPFGVGQHVEDVHCAAAVGRADPLEKLAEVSSVPAITHTVTGTPSKRYNPLCP
jgi:hypothetical protein